MTTFWAATEPGSPMLTIDTTDPRVGRILSAVATAADGIKASDKTGIRAMRAEYLLEFMDNLFRLSDTELRYEADRRSAFSAVSSTANLMAAELVAELTRKL